MVEKIGLSQPKACAAAICNRKTFRRVLKRGDDEALLQRLQELATERRRFGYRRLDIFLRRDGIIANHKRIYRVYAEANLQVRKRVKRRVALGRGDVPPVVSMPNKRWSLDFVHDTLQNSRRLRTLNIVDDYTREALAIEVDTSISCAGCAGFRPDRRRAWLAQDDRDGQRHRADEPGDACVVGEASRTISLNRAG